MKSNWRSFLIGVSLFLFVPACFRQDPGPPQPRHINIDSSATPPEVTLEITNEVLSVTTNSIGQIANSARLFVGASFSDIMQDEPVTTTEHIFAWYTQDSCQTLPQGENLVMRYEIYDEQGRVIKEDRITVTIRSCP